VRAPVAAGTLALALILTACTSGADALAEQYRSGSGQNYISGDGAITVIAPESRSEPVIFGGELDSGGTFASADYAGSVLVVNFGMRGVHRVDSRRRIWKKFLRNTGTKMSFLWGSTFLTKPPQPWPLRKNLGSPTPPSWMSTSGLFDLPSRERCHPTPFPPPLSSMAKGALRCEFLVC